MRIISNNLLILFFLSFITIASTAQEHSMHMSHPTIPAANNTYLLMMDKMMNAMDKAQKGKNAEEEFLLQMIPHHLGAVDMARYEITHGKNFEMIQLAKSILAEQQTELTEMKIWLSRPLRGDVVISPAFAQALERSMTVMMRNMPPSVNLSDTDHAFAAVMLPHHQAAIDMAKALLISGKQQQIVGFAKMLISNEQIEIQQMSTYLQ